MAEFAFTQSTCPHCGNIDVTVVAEVVQRLATHLKAEGRDDKIDEVKEWLAESDLRIAQLDVVREVPAEEVEGR